MKKSSPYHLSHSFSIKYNLKTFCHISLFTVLLIVASCKKADVPVVKRDDEVVPKTANSDKIVAFKSFKGTQSTPYDLVVIGDSYVQGNYFTETLRENFLADSYRDGGPGYCSFGRYDVNDLSTIDSSIDPSELTFTYDVLKWSFNQENTVGPCGDVKSLVDNAAINVTATVALNTLTIIYEKFAGAGNFRYRVNGGTWTTVSAEATQTAMANEVINTSAAGTAISLEIESLKSGQIFCGVVGRKGTNAITVHKAGIAGGIAIEFGQSDLWANSVKVLNPKGFVVMFGTNEMEINITPEEFRQALQFLLDDIRQASPNADIMLMCPPETKYENEDPRKYKIRDYGRIAYEEAIAYNTAFVNFADIFPHFSQASVDQGYMDADRKHPGVKGGQIIAQTIHDIFSK